MRKFLLSVLRHIQILKNILSNDKPKTKPHNSVIVPHILIQDKTVDSKIVVSSLLPLPFYLCYCSHQEEVEKEAVAEKEEVKEEEEKEEE